MRESGGQVMHLDEEPDQLTPRMRWGRLLLSPRDDLPKVRPRRDDLLDAQRQLGAF